MNRLLLLALLPLAAALALWGCDNDTSNEISDPGGGGTPPSDLTCVGCHRSEAMLKDALAKTSGSEVPVPVKADG